MRPGTIRPGRLSHLASPLRKVIIQAASSGRSAAGAPPPSVGGEQTRPGTRRLYVRAAHSRGKHPWRLAAPPCPRAQSGTELTVQVAISFCGQTTPPQVPLQWPCDGFRCSQGGGRLDAIITRRLVSALLRSSVGCLRVFVVYVSASRLRGVTAACGGHSWSFVSFGDAQLRGFLFRVSEGSGSTSSERRHFRPLLPAPSALGVGGSCVCAETPSGLGLRSSPSPGSVEILVSAQFLARLQLRPSRLLPSARDRLELHLQLKEKCGDSGTHNKMKSNEENMTILESYLILEKNHE
ncbi:hypothetical protein NDU88_000432 [Pleurodeles waltl]|uniref:Uncharacterized protein n=1 Tax=Pleurodeles waltl TaxID=8319 RepID=A0AAV7NAG7_PLEWA|nr:hypothetical protein NDU88_000432 [Pleurodeles waltl]